MNYISSFLVRHHQVLTSVLVINTTISSIKIQLFYLHCHCLSAACLTFMLAHPSIATVLAIGCVRILKESWDTVALRNCVHVYDVRSIGKGVRIQQHNDFLINQVCNFLAHISAVQDHCASLATSALVLEKQRGGWDREQKQAAGLSTLCSSLITFLSFTGVNKDE